MPRQLVRASNHDRNRSLGWLAVAWMEYFLVHGPGDVQGERIHHTDEQTGFIVDCYALDEDGRRLYDSAFLSRPKGTDKSGQEARFGLFEAFGPCRGSGEFARGGEVYRDPWGFGFEYTYEPGEPMGRSIKAPVVRCLATEEGQVGNVYNTIHFNLTDGPLAGALARKDDAGLSRIIIPGGGQIIPSTASSSAKDGGIETFLALDEALALDTPLRTPTGWTTMGDVCVGDDLVGADGLSVRVVKVTEIQQDRQCYRVTFKDGSSVVASDGHMWMTRLPGSAAKAKIRTTGEMIADGRKMAVPPTPLIQTPPVDLPIDPYVLGAWLGDGDSTNATISASDADIGAMAESLQARGYTTTQSRPSLRAPRLYVSLPGSHRNRWSPVDGLKARLTQGDLLGAKRIPEEYLLAGTEQRLELLRGLMDTDGSINASGGCVFANSNAELIRAFCALLTSLGQRWGVGWQKDERSRVGRTGRVWFTPRHGIQPFSMPRKARLVRNIKPVWNNVVSIEPVESVPVRCVAVDSDDHLFLAGEGCVVTHNTHLYNRPELRQMYKVTTRNLRKRKKIAETWYLEGTTMYQAGEDSSAEETYKLAQLIQEGKTKRERLLLDHRWGEIGMDDLDDEAKIRAALVDSYGDALAWNDLDGLVNEVLDPRTDISDSIRYFFNDSQGTENSWIQAYEWRARFYDTVHADAPLGHPTTRIVADGEAVTLGFDGSRKRGRGVTDATALVGCTLADGHVFPIDIWEQPAHSRDWEVPVADVLAAVDQAFAKYRVIGFYADPAKWESHVAGWEAKYGPKLPLKSTVPHPIEWWMTGGRSTLTVRALEKFRSAVIDGEMTHDGASNLTRHVLAARMVSKPTGVQIAKEHPTSERKIDGAIAAMLAWQARLDALAKGINVERERRNIMRVR